MVSCVMGMVDGRGVTVNGKLVAGILPAYDLLKSRNRSPMSPEYTTE
jgi:hypothetical protein